MFIDYKELKAKFHIQDAVIMLGLTPKKEDEQLRCACSACEGDDRSLVITPSKEVYYCFAEKSGGDVLSFVAHVKQCTVNEAAKAIVEYLRVDISDVPETVPEPDSTLEEREPLANLAFEHKAVQAFGLGPQMAEDLGIGYCKRGMFRGKVVIPLYYNQLLVGYTGYSAEDGSLRFPSNLTSHEVVELKKEA